MRIRSLVLLVLALYAGCAESATPPAKGPQPVAWSAEVADQTPSADGGVVVNIRIKATIANGWHVYSLTQKGGGPTPLSVEVDSTPLLAIQSGLAGPVPDKALDPNFGVETETYTGTPIITVPVRVSAEALRSGKPIAVKVRSQACSDKLCLPAKTTTLSLTLPATK